MKSKPEFILMIGDEAILVVALHIKDEPLFVPHHDAKAIQLCLELIAKYPKAKITLFADILAQDVRQETLPKLGFLDRPKLIQHRLRQAFPHAWIRAWVNSSSGHNHILMAGLQGNNPLFDWLVKLQHRLPRICLVPMECAGILMRILPDAKDGWAMMISCERTGGFRQIVTHKGELIFTRLSPPPDRKPSAAEIAEIIRRDVNASLNYLSRLGLAESAQLNLILLMVNDGIDEIEDVLPPISSLTILSPHKLAKYLVLPFIPYTTDPYADLVFAGWLAKKRAVRLKLLTPEIRQAFWHKSIRTHGQKVAIAAMLLAIIFTGLSATPVVGNSLTIHQEKQQLAALQKELLDTRALAAPLTEPLGKLQKAYERQKLFAEPTLLPWEVFTQLHKGLGEMHLTKLDWQSDSEKNETLLISVHLVPAEDREQALENFKQLASAITQSMPHYNVAVVHAPVPATPQEAISNKNELTDTEVAEFSIHRSEP